MTRLGIDTRSILAPYREARAYTMSATDRVRVMESRARRGNVAAIEWMRAYHEASPYRASN